MTEQPQHKKKIVLSQLSLFEQVVYWCGVGFGSGLFPKAPGTMGSLLVLVLAPLWLYLGFTLSAIVIIAMCLIGIPICGLTAKIMAVHDDARIVWDEFAGQSIALLPFLYFATLNIWTLLIAFALFRLFDIWKPWPIRTADAVVHGGFGIMLDDILAGLLAAMVAYIGLSLDLPFSLNF